jgi:hypothetical protein
VRRIHDAAGGTFDASPVLLAALRAVARRYRLPSLPADCEAARSHGAATVLAFAIEAARVGKQRNLPAPACARRLFTCALAALIREALAPEGGDPGFQAQVLQASALAVAEHVLLSGQSAADQRAVRGGIDAIAHPGKMRSLGSEPLRDALSRLHGLSTQGSWTELQQAVGRLVRDRSPRPGHGDGSEQRDGEEDLDEDAHQEVDKPADLNGHLRAQLEAVYSNAGLARLIRGAALRGQGSVRRYLALRERRGPLAGSNEAARQGRVGARLGSAAEHAAVRAFGKLADLLNDRDPGAARCRVVRTLRTPPGFPGAANRAKDEWDVAIVRDPKTGGAAQIVLLAEVKASATAATSDFSRLLRGLQRLAQANSDASYVFASADGPVRLAGESLRSLRPTGGRLPPTVIYCCLATAETRPQLLSAASRSVLLAEPASLEFAGRVIRGEPLRHETLTPVWEALTEVPRLRPVLQQHETMRVVREAMLHPDDLLVAVAQLPASICEA